jgi:8-oxo-dGTP pyrophosphatase MutT (NUDIX family)
MIAVWYEDTLLVITHAYWRGATLPGGHVRRRETPTQAAARELEEEVGIAVSTDRLHPVGQIQTRHTDLSLFECRLSQPTRIEIDNREITGAEFRPPSELRYPSPLLRSYLRERRLRWSAD